MTLGQRNKCRRMFWRGYNEFRIARRLRVSPNQVRNVLFGRNA